MLVLGMGGVGWSGVKIFKLIYTQHAASWILGMGMGGVSSCTGNTLRHGCWGMEMGGVGRGGVVTFCSCNLGCPWHLPYAWFSRAWLRVAEIRQLPWLGNSPSGAPLFRNQDICESF